MLGCLGPTTLFFSRDERDWHWDVNAAICYLNKHAYCCKVSQAKPKGFLFKFPKGQVELTTGSGHYRLSNTVHIGTPCTPHSNFGPSLSTPSEWWLSHLQSVLPTFLEKSESRYKEKTGDSRAHYTGGFHQVLQKLKWLSCHWFGSIPIPACWTSQEQLPSEWRSFAQPPAQDSQFHVDDPGKLSSPPGSCCHCWAVVLAQVSLLKGCCSAHVLGFLIISCLLKIPGLRSQSAQEYTKIGEGISQNLDVCIHGWLLIYKVQYPKSQAHTFSSSTYAWLWAKGITLFFPLKRPCQSAPPWLSLEMMVRLFFDERA